VLDRQAERRFMKVSIGKFRDNEWIIFDSERTKKSPLQDAVL
jgi:hypothetical protein